MKKVILLAAIAVLFQISVSAQEAISFEKVFTVDSVSKNQIYSKIKEHFTVKLNKPRFFKIDDRETGILKTISYKSFDKKGFAYQCYCGSIEFEITIQVRDGRYKVTLSNFMHKPNGMCELGIITSGTYKHGTINGKRFDLPVWEELQLAVDDIQKRLFAEFESINFKSDNW